MFISSSVRSKRAKPSFRPDFIAADVGSVDFGYLKKLGITTCFVDLDGTVVSRGTFEVDKDLARKLKQSGMDIKIATNRPRSRSLKELKQDLSASGVIHPRGLFGKPTKRYIRAALKEFGLQQTEVIMIGDRFLQDIWGANRSGIYSLLVHKLGASQGRFDDVLSGFERLLTRRLEAGYKRLK